MLAAAAVDEVLEPADAAALRTHLETCDPCRAEALLLQADHRRLAAIAPAAGCARPRG
jgi:anti-sigma factor RsiW